MAHAVRGASGAHAPRQRDSLSRRPLLSSQGCPVCTGHVSLSPDSQFRRLTRVSRAGFNAILAQIADHPVFHNSSNNAQEPTWLQLAVALDRLGHNGNGVALERTMLLWGISKGTCCLYTSRVLLALSDLSDRYVRWPSQSERRAISRRMEQRGFPGCVGFIDGTTIPLAQKPAVDGDCYYDRKHRYSVNAQVVCDDRRRIINFFSGWPGSSADSTVYKEMSLSKDTYKRLFFDEGQYIIADSAYPADYTHSTVLPSYKSNMKGSDIEDFNTCVANLRVVNEHTIGVLMGRWASLREIRIQVNQKEDMERVMLWFKGCVILHNMLIDHGDVWELEENEEEDEDEADDPGPDASDEEDKDAFECVAESKYVRLQEGAK
jgi:hypothetical protein